MSLTLSEYRGGPDVERRLACRLSDKLFRVFLEYKDKLLRPDEAILSVYFEYPGSITKHFDYVGLKQGVFSKKDKFFRIWVAVPDTLLDSPDFGDFYLAKLREAIEIAAHRFGKHAIPFSADDHLKIVDTMAMYLGEIKAGI